MNVQLANPHALSPRELEIVALRVDYHSTEDITHRLNISRGRVNQCLKTARLKFGAVSLDELLRHARLHVVTEDQR